MTPMTRHLYMQNRSLRATSYVYKSRLLNLKKRLCLARNMQNLNNSGLRREALEFCVQQLNRKITKPRGRRYSTNDKLMSLSLYKTSGAAYRFLAQWFNLPSKSTILRLLSKIPIGEGFNDTIINNIHSSIRLLRPVDRLCVVVFDEISLSTGIHYSSTRDVMVGVNNGNIVQYALVFLLRGITKKWKQTVCYSFSKGPATANRIKDQLVTLIKKLNRVNGLRIVATVCDQVLANRSAIEDLVNMGVASDVANNRPPKRRILMERTLYLCMMSLIF